MSRYSAMSEALLNTCIDEFCLRSERPSLAALQLEVRRRFAERTLAVVFRIIWRSFSELFGVSFGAPL
jgi:hypothetical protein